jgi:DNA replication protein DnaC
MTDLISTDLKAVMRRLRLGKLLDTLPERLALARQHKMPHQDFLFTLLSDECQRRDAAATTTRAQRALLDPEMMLERWDRTAKVTYDETLLAELVSLRFVDAHRHATIVGPVGVGKTFIAHALGHIACRRGFTVLALRADRLLKMLKHARLDHSHEAELRKLLAIDVLIIDDFCLDTMDAIESRDVHEISLSAIAPGPSSSPRTADPTSGCRPSPIQYAPRLPSTDSPRTPTTWSSRASPTASASSPSLPAQGLDRRRADRATDQGQATAGTRGECS